MTPPCLRSPPFSGSTSRATHPTRIPAGHPGRSLGGHPYQPRARPRCFRPPLESSSSRLLPLPHDERPRAFLGGGVSLHCLLVLLRADLVHQVLGNALPVRHLAGFVLLVVHAPTTQLIRNAYHLGGGAQQHADVGLGRLLQSLSGAAHFPLAKPLLHPCLFLGGEGAPLPRISLMPRVERPNGGEVRHGLRNGRRAAGGPAVH